METHFEVWVCQTAHCCSGVLKSSGDATSRVFQIQTLAPDFLMSLFFCGHFPTKRHPACHRSCGKSEATRGSSSENTQRNLSSLGLNWSPAYSVRMVFISPAFRCPQGSSGTLRQSPAFHFAAHKEKWETLEERFGLCQTGTEDTSEKLPPCLDVRS